MSELVVPAAQGRPASGQVRVANAPVSFGVDEILIEDAWMPTAAQVLDMIRGEGYAGTELGPPGYLGTADEVRERLSSRDLELVGSFLPQRFSEAEFAEEDRAWLRDALTLVRDGSPEGSHPFAILCDGFDQPLRMQFSGRIPEHPEAWLPDALFPIMIDNLHRAAELARSMGFDVVLHPHAGTFIETSDEVSRVMDAIDPSLLGLCLDTGHLRFGGADPTALVHRYHELIRHVHVKDARMSIMDGVKAEGLGLEVALARGVFCELGDGDSGIADVLAALQEHGYTGWIVVEQDRFLTADDTLASVDASNVRNRAYLLSLGF